MYLIKLRVFLGTILYFTYKKLFSILAIQLFYSIIHPIKYYKIYLFIYLFILFYYYYFFLSYYPTLAAESLASSNSQHPTPATHTHNHKIQTHHHKPHARTKPVFCIFGKLSHNWKFHTL
jgi:hypothetical protein